MFAQEPFSGQWKQLKGEIKQQWGQLTDKELQVIEGRCDQVVGFIEHKTGEKRRQIAHVCEQFTDEAGGQSY